MYDVSYNYIPLTRVDQQVSQEAGVAINSPILFDLLNSLSQDAHHEILDICPASQGVIDAFSHYDCKLYLPGCVNALCEMTAEEYDTANSLYRAFTRALGLTKKQNAALNVILLWDLPNYLDKGIMRGLIDYLSHHMHENVKLHFYIHSQQHMPATPASYTILPEGKVWLENRSETTVKSPLYFQEALLTLFQPFKVKRSMLLASGLKEYILALE